MDPGIDDALALIAACRSAVEIMGVSVVAGNLPLETVTANASGILNFMGVETKVYKGAACPLYGKLEDAAAIHGPGGLGGWSVEPDRSRISQEHAVRFLAETARAHPGDVTLVTTGPLTNLAIALEYHRRDIESLAGVVFMGGALKVPGNVTPAAEYNIYADPDAAEIVFNSGLDLTMVGLDVTQMVCIDTRETKDLSKGSEAARAVAAMAGYYLETNPRLPLHDPLALLAAIEPGLFEFQKLPVRVETRGEFSRGRTIADFGGKLWRENVNVALSVQADRCREILLDLWAR